MCVEEEIIEEEFRDLTSNKFKTLFYSFVLQVNRLVSAAKDMQSVGIIESVKMENALVSVSKLESQKQEDDSTSTSRASMPPGLIDNKECDKVTGGGDCAFDMPVPSIDPDLFDSILIDLYQLRSRTTHTVATKIHALDMIVDVKKGDGGFDDDDGDDDEEDKESIGTLSDTELFGSCTTRAAATSRDRGGVDDSSDEEYPLLPRNYISRERLYAFEQFIANGGQIEFMGEMQSKGFIHSHSLEID